MPTTNRNVNVTVTLSFSSKSDTSTRIWLVPHQFSWKKVLLTQHLADIGLNIHILEVLESVGVEKAQGGVQTNGHPDAITHPGQLTHLALLPRVGIKRFLETQITFSHVTSIKDIRHISRTTLPSPVLFIIVTTFNNSVYVCVMVADTWIHEVLPK